MSIQFKKYDHVIVVEMPSKLVYANANATKESVFELIENNSKKLSLNLANTIFIDSSGLAVLVAILKRVSKLDGEIALLSPSKNARLLIELTRLDKIFSIYEDRQSVIHDLNAA
jgi:anti-sigma B factor antagonist